MMTEEDDRFEPDFDVAYYLLDGNRIARLWYDTETDEYFDAEVMGEDGQWEVCTPEEIEAQGPEDSIEDSEQLARAQDDIL